MTLRVRQTLLTLGLVGPLIASVFTLPPLAAPAHAAGPLRMVGPRFPVKVDSNNNGMPDAGDESVGTTLNGNLLTVNSRWHCDPNGTENVLTLSNPDGLGRFQTISRQNGNLTQTVTAIPGPKGVPTQFTWTEINALSGGKSGVANLIDLNGDGVIDQLMIGGGGVNAVVSFSFTPNAQDISIPWAQASSLGVNFSATCGGSQPQIWIPLADTNGDGIGDTIVPDLDGNGVADPQFLPAPRVTAPAVPSMGVLARVILTVLLGATAVWFLSRRQTLATPSAS